MMFVIFMANFGISVVQTNWVDHEIEHALHQVPMSMMEVSVNDTDLTAPIDDDHDAGSVIGHQLLHAVDHLQLFPFAALHIRMAKSTGTVLSQFTAVELPATTLEAPFRPPRSTPFSL